MIVKDSSENFSCMKKYQIWNLRPSAEGNLEHLMETSTGVVSQLGMHKVEWEIWIFF